MFRGAVAHRYRHSSRYGIAGSKPLQEQYPALYPSYNPTITFLYPRSQGDRNIPQYHPFILLIRLPPQTDAFAPPSPPPPMHPPTSYNGNTIQIGPLFHRLEVIALVSDDDCFLGRCGLTQKPLKCSVSTLQTSQYEGAQVYHKTITLYLGLNTREGLKTQVWNSMLEFASELDPIVFFKEPPAGLC